MSEGLNQPRKDNVQEGILQDVETQQAEIVMLPDTVTFLNVNNGTCTVICFCHIYRMHAHVFVVQGE